MGSSSSKAARTATGAGARKYPTRIPPASGPQARRTEAAGPTTHPRAQASETRDEAINHDASDPQFAASLRSLGAVKPINMYSPSSTVNTRTGAGADVDGRSSFPDHSANPALQILQARERFAKEAEREFDEIGRSTASGRRYLDVITIRHALMLRDQQRLPAREIERKLGLKEGVVDELGPAGVVAVAAA